MLGRWKFYDIDNKRLAVKTAYDAYIAAKFPSNATIANRIASIESSYNEAKAKIDALL